MFTSEQLDKIKLIDKFFNAFNFEEMQEFVNREEIVARLKGKSSDQNCLTDMVLEHDKLRADVMTLQGDLSSLRYDFQVLVKSVVKPYEYGISTDIHTLKSKHNIY